MIDSLTLLSFLVLSLLTCHVAISQLNTPTLRISLGRLRCNVESVGMFLSNFHLINCSTLWNCLHEQDCNNDRLGDSDLQSVGSSKVPFHLRLRVDILRQLYISFKNEFNSFSSVGKKNATLLRYSLRHIPRVYYTTMALSSCMSNIDKVRYVCYCALASSFPFL